MGGLQIKRWIVPNHDLVKSWMREMEDSGELENPTST